MAKYSQLVKPNLKVTADAGLCLQFARKVYGAPAIYPSAWEAWKKAPGRHSGKHPSNVSVPVWFSHYGTYGKPPRYANWGHVVAYVPGKGYLSSPGSGHGQRWFKTIAEIERYFNCKYVGWSEGINGVRVVKTATPASNDRSKPVAYVSGWKSASNTKSLQKIVEGRTFLHINESHGVSITKSIKNTKLITGRVLITGSIHLTGTPGTKFTFGATRGTYSKAAGWKEYGFLESIRGEIDETGQAKLSLTISNSLPKGQRLRFYVHPDTDSEPMLVQRFSWKGFELA